MQQRHQSPAFLRAGIPALYNILKETKQILQVVQMIPGHIIQGIFKNKSKREFIQKLAETNGLVILTDSDHAGQIIRNHIKSFVKNGRISERMNYV